MPRTLPFLGLFRKNPVNFIGLILARSELCHQYEKYLKDWICAHQLIVPPGRYVHRPGSASLGLELDAS